MTETDLEARLRLAGSLPLPDNGFTAGVLERLPRRRSSLGRWLLPAVGAGLGLALVQRQRASWQDLSAAANQVQNLLSAPGLLLAAGLVIACFVLAPGPDEAFD